MLLFKFPIRKSRNHFHPLTQILSERVSRSFITADKRSALLCLSYLQSHRVARFLERWRIQQYEGQHIVFKKHLLIDLDEKTAFRRHMPTTSWLCRLGSECFVSNHRRGHYIRAQKSCQQRSTTRTALEYSSAVLQRIAFSAPRARVFIFVTRVLRRRD